MTVKNLTRRLERLEENLLPVLEEPLILKFMSIDSEGRRGDSGIEFKIPAARKPIKKRHW